MPRRAAISILTWSAVSRIISRVIGVFDQSPYASAKIPYPEASCCSVVRSLRITVWTILIASGCIPVKRVFGITSFTYSPTAIANISRVSSDMRTSSGVMPSSAATPSRMYLPVRSCGVSALSTISDSMSPEKFPPWNRSGERYSERSMFLLLACASRSFPISNWFS